MLGSVPSASRRTIPLLDIRLFQTNPTQFVEELRRACHRTGFFLLRHDLQPPSLPLRQLEETTRFFVEHSLEEKMQISYENSPSFRGFMRLGVEQTAGLQDVREQIEVVAEYSSTGENDDETTTTLLPTTNASKSVATSGLPSNPHCRKRRNNICTKSCASPSSCSRRSVWRSDSIGTRPISCLETVRTGA